MDEASDYDRGRLREGIAAGPVRRLDRAKLRHTMAAKGSTPHRRPMIAREQSLNEKDGGCGRTAGSMAEAGARHMKNPIAEAKGGIASGEAARGTSPFFARMAAERLASRAKGPRNLRYMWPLSITRLSEPKAPSTSRKMRERPRPRTSREGRGAGAKNDNAASSGKARAVLSPSS
jgi:hypothetical protein